MSNLYTAPKGMSLANQPLSPPSAPTKASPTTTNSTMNKLALPESAAFLSNNKTSQFIADCWFDDDCILDMDYFVKTLAAIKDKGVRPDLVGSIIAHYASKWLPDLLGDETEAKVGLAIDFNTKYEGNSSPESVTALWMKKRFFVETLVGILPLERDSVPCNFLLRLLRTANMVGVEPTCRAELERRISRQLDQASLKELMIPSFSYTCGTLLDVGLVLRLVERFMSLDEAALKSGVALMKVAKLVDSYLAEAALESNLTIQEFVALASVLPGHARSIDDGLYRAIDTYLKTHSTVSKQERKTICRLMDTRKLSPEASLHAAQNDRLPVRTVIQVLLSEQTKLNRHLDWSGSFSGTRSPNVGFDGQARCPSKREMNVQQTEIKKLREDVYRLQSQCYSMQIQIEKLMERKKGFFRWKKLGMPSLRNNFDRIDDVGEGVRDNFGRMTPMDMKTKLIKGKAPPRWRQSLA